MINSLSAFFSNSRVLAVLGLLIVAGLLLLNAATLKKVLLALLVLTLVALAAAWLWRRIVAKKSAAALHQMVAGGEGETPELRQRLEEALRAIKSSRLGRRSGSEALYELPWLMVIGNPAAGKSTAVLNSGLTFPFNDQKGSALQGIGGTRNCDWYFTTEGILLDTAGRYSVQDEDRGEWLTFLSLLRKHRPRAPINGIIIAASVAELTGNSPEFAIDLAKKLRQRIQELTERLEVVAPVYVVFTKVDLINGFNDFFQTLEPQEREKVWGATFAFNSQTGLEAVSQFDQHFDELCDGLKEMSLAQMALNRGGVQVPGLLTLPLEFKGIKASLSTFLMALFEENPYQYRPVFRGFYFTSAVQEIASVCGMSNEIARRFGLSAAQQSNVPGEDPQLSRHSYFLLDLFRKVVFVDRELVRQYSSRSRTRKRSVAFLGTALLLGGSLAGWTWSYTNNQQLVSNVQADLRKAQDIQKDRIDLQSRLEALQVIQDRLGQLQKYRDDHPLMLGLGLYQGAALEAKLRHEYFQGMRQVMLTPVAEQLESYLRQVSANSTALKPAQSTAAVSATSVGVYQAPSPSNVQDAYNALKAYLMLGTAERVEPAHLSDQLTRFWRLWLEDNRGGMDREDMARRAERLMSFYIRQSNAPDWPVLDTKVTLTDDSRRTLSSVMQGLPARDRVYAELKARAATRYPSVTVAGLLGEGDKIFAGSYAISGAFSREAWEGYVKQAIRDASHKELTTTDWVLQSARADDLTLSGSPEHIQKELEQLYTQEYIAEWRKFLQGITVASFSSFSDASAAMNQLGDPQNSPMRKLMEAIYRQTSWDNPSLINEGLKTAKGGFLSWFSKAPAEAQALARDNAGEIPVGPVGLEFSGIARLMVARDSAPSLLQSYLQNLSGIRTRLNAIQTQGDPGPGARELMVQTLDASPTSELSAGLRLVDEQLLSSMEDGQRRTLRPLLLWPMIQTFGALIPPTHNEINKVWKAQVHEPFQQTLAGKYPFAPAGQIEAGTAEISQVFGPQGSIAQFVNDSLGPLVIRRGNSLVSKQWADVGLSLSPSLMTNFAQWVAPLGQTAEGGALVTFQVLPGSAAGFSEYSVLVGDQQLRYRNTPAQWNNFVWDSSKPNQTAKVSVVTYDGRAIDLQSFVGQNALGQLIQSAQSRQNADGSYELQWRQDDWVVPVTMKIISNPRANADGSQRKGLDGTQLPLAVVGLDATLEERP